MATIYLHNRFRFGNDDGGTEGNYTFSAAENAGLTIAEDSTTRLLRIHLTTVGSSANITAGVSWQWQYKLNAGSWTNITTTSSVIKAVDASSFTNADETAIRLTTDGTGGISPNDGCTEDGTSGTGGDFAKAKDCETVLAFQIVTADVVPGDVVSMMAYNASITSYDATPTITFSSGATIIPIIMANNRRRRT